MQNELPKWAMEEAAALRSAVVWQSNASNEVIARALLAAEQRGRKAGLEEAAKVAHDAAKPHARSLLSKNMNGTWPLKSKPLAIQAICIAAAIRQLGETT